MRLTHQQQAEVRAAVQAHFGPGAQIWLFGSRADDSARGGDIDLYVETPKHSGMEKRGIIRTVDDWRRLRDARNLLTHEYPRLPEEQAEALNTAYREAAALIGTLDALVRYVRERLGLAI